MSATKIEMTIKTLSPIRFTDGHQSNLGLPISLCLCPLIPYMVINEVLQLIDCKHAVWILSRASNLFFNGSLS